MDIFNPEQDLALHHTPGHDQDPGPFVHVVYQEAGTDQDPDLHLGHSHSQ